MNNDDGKPRRYWLYVLFLEEHKYYVGVTSKSPMERFEEHRHGIRAANWTRRYKPLKLIDYRDLGVVTYAEAQKYEAKVVRLYLKKYGINNARGGDLTDVSDYIVRFRHILDLERWETMTTVALLMLLLFAMYLLYIFK